MNNIISILIPARNEIFLQKTIENVIDNAQEEIEIIAVLDGYEPNPPIEDHPFVKLIRHKEAQGQRQSINEAARVAKGKYIMKLDAHCALDKGFDVKLKADCEYDWTVIPAMRNLDVKTWKPKEIDSIDRALSRRKLNSYMFIGWNEKNELRTLYYSDKENRKLWERAEQIDDTMSCMGCCFFMHKDRFWELGGCDETHGGWGQQGVEVACKAWLSGGSLKVNKKTWFAHWFRAGDGGFPYSISGRTVQAARNYSKELWLNNKWEKQVRPFSWLLEKFNPPSWENYNKIKVKTEININREIRQLFGVRIQNDFAPYGTKAGTKRELLPVLWNSLGYKVGAEIGVKRGSFSKHILETMQEVKLYSIDAWQVYKHQKTEKEMHDKNYEVTMLVLRKFGDRSVIQKKPSLEAVETFADGSLDFVFIDGDHTFNAAVQDIIKWSSKVRKGGMVAVHDYTPMRRGGVIEAVDAYTKCNLIRDWYVIREALPTAFWVKE